MEIIKEKWGLIDKNNELIKFGMIELDDDTVSDYYFLTDSEISDQYWLVNSEKIIDKTLNNYQYYLNSYEHPTPEYMDNIEEYKKIKVEIRYEIF